CRGRGMGSALVRRIEAEARSLGVSTLYLYTPHTESLYERLGWSVTERCEYRNTNVVVMSKELACIYGCSRQRDRNPNARGRVQRAVTLHETKSRHAMKRDG
ncbi:MAG: GNAT family N-acetyltransferase, partial [Candidatus Udaeobacter sp.]